jgi:hypothetical protein
MVVGKASCCYHAQPILSFICSLTILLQRAPESMIKAKFSGPSKWNVYETLLGRFRNSLCDSSSQSFSTGPVWIASLVSAFTHSVGPTGARGVGPTGARGVGSTGARGVGPTSARGVVSAGAGRRSATSEKCAVRSRVDNTCFSASDGWLRPHTTNGYASSSYFGWNSFSDLLQLPTRSVLSPIRSPLGVLALFKVGRDHREGTLRW